MKNFNKTLDQYMGACCQAVNVLEMYLSQIDKRPSSTPEIKAARVASLIRARAIITRHIIRLEGAIDEMISERVDKNDCLDQLPPFPPDCSNN